MKSIFKTAVLNIVAILLISSYIGGLTYGNQVFTLLLAALALSFANAFIKPFLKILLLPINIITLGLTGWIVNVVLLYLVTYLIPGFSVEAFTLNLGSTNIVLSQFFSYVFISFSLSIVTSCISWLIE